MKSRSFYLNIDINSAVTPFLNRASEEANPGKETLYPFVDTYSDTPITDILFDIFCQYSNTASSIWTDYAAKYEQKTENGVTVDYTELYRGLNRFNKEFGIDPYRVWFDRCREKGIHPWITLRMNDCHCPDDPASFLRSDFFYEAREKGWMIGDKYGYYRHCFDYAQPVVRQKMLDYIREQLFRYDVDGLELDYSREWFCFDYPNRPDCFEIMNDFVREVKKIVSAAEEKHGHPIRIGVRLMRDIAQNKVLGYDAETWVKEKLVDHICVCPRWASCDSDMPIREWKNRFPDIEISAGLTDLILTSFGENESNVGGTPGILAAYVIRFLSEGADAIYLFNFFHDPYNIAAKEKYHPVYTRCDSIEHALSGDYRFILTYQDLVPEGCAGWRPLPVNVKSSGTEVPIDLGLLPQDRHYELIVGFSAGSPSDIYAECNGTPLEKYEPYNRSKVDPDNLPFCAAGTELYRMEIPTVNTPKLNFRFLCKNDGITPVISYMEIEVTKTTD